MKPSRLQSNPSITRKSPLIPALVLIALSSVFSSAAIVASYNFTTGTNVDEGVNYTTAGTKDANATVGNLIKGAGLQINSSTTGWSTKYTTASDGADNSDLAEAISKNAYVSFEFGAASGYELDLNGGSLTVQYRAVVGTVGTTAPTNLALMFGATGFGSGNYSVGVTGLANVTHTLTFNISNISLNNLTGTQEFRIYQWNPGDTTTTGGGTNINFGTSAGLVTGSAAGDNIILQGSVAAVPEPNVAALLGGLGTLALLRRRRTF